jgi:hypothetical protein
VVAGFEHLVGRAHQGQAGLEETGFDRAADRGDDIVPFPAICVRGVPVQQPGKARDTVLRPLIRGEPLGGEQAQEVVQPVPVRRGSLDEVSVHQPLQGDDDVGLRRPGERGRGAGGRQPARVRPGPAEDQLVHRGQLAIRPGEGRPHATVPVPARSRSATSPRRSSSRRRRSSASRAARSATVHAGRTRSRDPAMRTASGNPPQRRTMRAAACGLAWTRACSPRSTAKSWPSGNRVRRSCARCSANEDLPTPGGPTLTSSRHPLSRTTGSGERAGSVHGRPTRGGDAARPTGVGSDTTPWRNTDFSCTVARCRAPLPAPPRNTENRCETRTYGRYGVQSNALPRCRRQGLLWKSFRLFVRKQWRVRVVRCTVMS